MTYIPRHAEGVKDSSGNPAGNVVAELQPITGVVEYVDVFFNAATEMPDYAQLISGVPVADVIKITGFTTGKKRCRISYIPLEDLGIPFAIGVRATLNSPDSLDAAAKLTITDNTGGATVSPLEGAVPQTACKQKPVIEWDLTGTDYDIDDIYLIGVAPDGAGASDVLVTIEVY